MDSKIFPTTQILLNSNNYDKVSNSFTYTFNSDQTFNNHVIGIQQCVLYNQFYNISSAIGNNKITVEFPSGSSSYVSTTYTIPDGYYDSAETFSTWLQSKLLASKYCTFPTTTTTKYFIEMGTTTTQYAFYLTLYPVSTSDTPPSGATWTKLTGAARTPRITFGSLGTVWGYDKTTVYGTGLSIQTTINSPITPQIRDSTTIIFTANVCNNGGLSFPSDFLYSLRISGALGAAMRNQNQEVIYQKIPPASYRQIIIKLYDQNMKPLTILDSNVMFLLLLRKNDK